MRALEPVQSGFVDRDGVAIHYEVYGDGSPTVYLLMPDTIVESRGWKAQIPFLARLVPGRRERPARKRAAAERPTLTRDMPIA